MVEYNKTDSKIPKMGFSDQWLIGHSIVELKDLIRAINRLCEILEEKNEY